MKKFVIVVLSIFVVIGIALSVAAYRFVPRVQPNLLLGKLQLGELTKSEAQAKIVTWWKSAEKQPLSLTSPLLGKRSIKVKPRQVGVSLDVKASLALLPYDNLWERMVAFVKRDPGPSKQIEPVFTFSENGFNKLRDLVEDTIGGRRSARAYYRNGVIEREPEVSGSTLDNPVFAERVPNAITQGKSIDIPLIEAPKNVSNEALDSITDVVSEFGTHFPARQFSRNTNIQTASAKLNGVVLAPGEKFSFNGTVGRRTLRNGFKLAGVYKNGKHDIGIGGGICQVSSTLYNAALFADLKIIRRQNHSMPVAYLPVGRDATVDYGGIDLVFENTYKTPIAINSSFTPGRLTFRILGKKDPTLSVKIVTTDHRSWSLGQKLVVDRLLPAGQKKIIEKGSAGHFIKTYRLVYHDGKLFKRELLGHSLYKGGVRIIATGPTATPLRPDGNTVPIQSPSNPE